MAVVSLSLSLSSCGFNIEHLHPHFLDTQKGYAMVYEAKKITPEVCGDPNYQFNYTSVNKPIDQMNGYICLPIDEVQEALRYYNEYLRKKANCRDEDTGSGGG